jgi:hypothetical protein
MLHIVDGESVAGTLRESGVPGEVRVYGDLLYEGPAPYATDAETWREARAGFLSASGYMNMAEARRLLTVFEETVAAVPLHQETILWFDHSLSNQLILIKLVGQAICPPAAGQTLSLVSGDGSAGFGSLTADRLAALAATRAPLSGAQFRLANAAWSAFTSPDPRTIEPVIQSETSPLPFLAAALRRHLEQFPSTRDGLSRTERQILQVLRERGPLSTHRLFAAVARMEDSPFLGNHSFARILRSLASARHPLVAAEESAVRIAPAGLRVLEGCEDHIQLNGSDRWLGGVHLDGSGQWRWDPDSGSIRFHAHA